jgi:hypothetical protein
VVELYGTGEGDLEMIRKTGIIISIALATAALVVGAIGERCRLTWQNHDEYLKPGHFSISVERFTLGFSFVDTVPSSARMTGWAELPGFSLYSDAFQVYEHQAMQNSLARTVAPRNLYVHVSLGVASMLLLAYPLLLLARRCARWHSVAQFLTLGWAGRNHSVYVRGTLTGFAFVLSFLFVVEVLGIALGVVMGLAVPRIAFLTIPVMAVPCSLIVAYSQAGKTYRYLRRRAIGGHAECARCGYNLTGNVSGVCPECGEKLVAS